MVTQRGDFQKKWAKVITKAWKDPAFKKQLLDNPDAALKKEGLDLPRGTHVKFHENTDKVLHFTLPHRPEGELSDQELMKIAAAAVPPTTPVVPGTGVTPSGQMGDIGPPQTG